MPFHVISCWQDKNSTKLKIQICWTVITKQEEGAWTSNLFRCQCNCLSREHLFGEVCLQIDWGQILWFFLDASSILLVSSQLGGRIANLSLWLLPEYVCCKYYFKSIFLIQDSRLYRWILAKSDMYAIVNWCAIDLGVSWRFMIDLVCILHHKEKVFRAALVQTDLRNCMLVLGFISCMSHDQLWNRSRAVWDRARIWVRARATSSFLRRAACPWRTFAISRTKSLLVMLRVTTQHRSFTAHVALSFTERR